jgi:hypothetical protein
MRWPWERHAALGGIVAVALWIIGALIIESARDFDEDNPADVLLWYQDNSDTILAGGFVFELGGAFFLIFLAALISRLWWAEGGTGFLSIAAMLGGLGTALFVMGTAGPDIAGALAEDELGADAAQALSNLDVAFFIVAQLSAVVLVAAVGVLALKAGALPAWLGWISLLLALLLIIPLIGWAALLVGLPIWTLAVSVMLFLKPRPPPGPPPITSQFVGTDLGGPEAPPPITSRFVGWWVRAHGARTRRKCFALSATKSTPRHMPAARTHVWQVHVPCGHGRLVRP